jgi:hypothetical protein
VPWFSVQFNRGRRCALCIPLSVASCCSPKQRPDLHTPCYHRTAPCCSVLCYEEAAVEVVRTSTETPGGSREKCTPRRTSALFLQLKFFSSLNNQGHCPTCSAGARKLSQILYQLAKPCEEWRLLGYKAPVRTPQETLRLHYRAQPVRFDVFTAVTMKNVVFWDMKSQFVLHRRHIMSPLQSPAG